jgi:hypothetical protein
VFIAMPTPPHPPPLSHQDRNHYHHDHPEDAELPYMELGVVKLDVVDVEKGIRRTSGDTFNEDK